MSPYNHKEVESRWAKYWYENNLYEAEDFSKKPKKYILAEFPYPSGKSLHAGHMMRYTVPDVYSRYLRMKGYNVLFPMGWDAFGLPAENYAVKSGVHPAITTKEAIKNYKNSVNKMGYGIDWSREINTTDPNYYKWTQWIFLKFFQQGLAEYKEMPIWWCEQLKTVLSDEEVLTDKDGNKISERGEHPVEKKMLKQWVLKITAYADKLIEGLNELDFPEAIKSAQINWIGRSFGANINFMSGDTKMEVFTTRPDTIFGVSFMAIAPESPILKDLIPSCKNIDEVKNYVKQSKDRSDLERQVEKEKTGVPLEGVFAKHPITDKKIPLFVADYVLMDYGTGVVMGVPAHDERDFDFAKKYGLEITPVIEAPQNFKGAAYTGNGPMINSEEYNGMDSTMFFEEIISCFEKENIGKRGKEYKLRDWIFSRQRYWGEPIPLIHTQNGKILPICDIDSKKEVDEGLPLKLPEVPDYTPSSDGASPLVRNKDWVNTKDENGDPAKRETNTMPNWAGSCWYFIRYTDPNNNEFFADEKKMKYWLPVDRYFGGAEHTTMHLLYSRFWYQFLYDQGLVPTPEPYQWRMNGGLLLGPDGTKMSKSKGNVIEPMDVVKNYGADALRAYICFLGPYTDTYPWNTNGVGATWRLMKNISVIHEKVMGSSVKKSSDGVKRSLNTLISNLTRMYESFKMNTAVSEIMIFVNAIKNSKDISTKSWVKFVKVLAPMAPFLAEELWQDINSYKVWKNENSVHLQPWPTVDGKYLIEDTITIPVQINGKIRSEVTFDKGSTEKEIEKLVMADENVEKHLKNETPKRYIYIEGKIVSIVV